MAGKPYTKPDAPTEREPEPEPDVADIVQYLWNDE